MASRLCRRRPRRLSSLHDEHGSHVIIWLLSMPRCRQMCLYYMGLVLEGGIKFGVFVVRFSIGIMGGFLMFVWVDDTLYAFTK